MNKHNERSPKYLNTFYTVKCSPFLSVSFGSPFAVEVWVHLDLFGFACPRAFPCVLYGGGGVGNGRNAHTARRDPLCSQVPRFPSTSGPTPASWSCSSGETLLDEVGPRPQFCLLFSTLIFWGQRAKETHVELVYSRRRCTQLNLNFPLDLAQPQTCFNVNY